MTLLGDHIISNNNTLGGGFAQDNVVSQHPSVAIDFESYYDKDISVTTMGAWHYARATDIYLVAMYFDDGSAFVGEPKDAPWDRCEGRDWIMHNAAFDLTLLGALFEKKVVPLILPNKVYDTADLAAYLSYPRSLKEAAHHLLGVEMSKTTRNNMKGLKWSQPTKEAA